MRLRTLISSLVLTTLATPAFAEPPSDASFRDAKVVGVLPVLTTGARAAAYQRLAAEIARAEGNGLLAPTTFAAFDASQGFGFAGASNASDIATLRVAFLLGAAPSVQGDTREIERILQIYANTRDVLAPLSPEVVAAADTFVAALKQNRVDATALATAMQRAEEGIAKGPARAHGYFAAGLWLGLSMQMAKTPEAESDFSAMATPLATLLEEDAELGGSDRTLAAELRRVSALLAQGRVDLGSYKDALTRAFAIEADR